MLTSVGSTVPTAALKPDGADSLDARRLTSFQIDFCWLSDKVNVSLAPVVLFRLDIWLAIEAAGTAETANRAATASVAGFFIDCLLDKLSPLTSTNEMPRCFINLKRDECSLIAIIPTSAMRRVTRDAGI